MLELTLALFGVALSAFFSGSELAFITANPLQVEVWAKQNRRGARQALRLMEDPDGFLISVLVGTTLSNIFATSFATIYLLRAGWHPVVALAVISATILLFGEVLPKTISGERPNHFFRVVAPLHRPWQILFAPVSVPLRKVTNYFHHWDASATDRRDETTLEREDLKLLFAAQKDPKVLPEREKQLISQVLDLREIPVSKAMTPRTEMATVAETDVLSNVIHTFIDSGNSKLPVYRDKHDDIIGVVYLYDMFKHPKDLASIIQPVTMVPASNTIMDVFKQLQRTHRSIAIVLDEYGGTAGLVTLEDLFEELFGEFEDEFDAPESESKRLPDGSVMTSGKTKVDDLNGQFQLQIPEGDYESIAGYLTATLGRIPFKGEQIYLPFGLVIIKKSSLRRIDQVQIYPGPDGGSLGRG